MSVQIVNVTFNSTDARALAQWWATVLGGTTEDPFDGAFVKVLVDGGQGLAVQQVDDPTPGRRRLHLDMATEDLDAETERLVGLGATVLERQGEPGGFQWTVFNDPDGNQFCVAPAG